MATAKRLPSGNWRVRIYTGKDTAGKRQYKSFTSSDKWEAEQMALSYRQGKREGEKAGITVGEAIDQYIMAKENVLSPKTVLEYRNYRRIYFQELMPVPIGRLDVIKVQRAVNEASKRLSPKSIRNVHGLLSATLKMHRPDFDLSTALPPPRKRLTTIPNEEEIIALLERVRGLKIEIPILLTICLGVRRGEISAIDLHKDIDYKNNKVKINKAYAMNSDKEWVLKAPKSYEGSRILDAPAPLIEKLRAARDAEYVFQNPNKITHEFCRVRKQVGLENCRFHDLRHYNASVMLALGVPDKYAMQRLGQSTPNVLKNVYQHLIDSKKEEVSQKVTDAFTGILRHGM